MLKVVEKGALREAGEELSELDAITQAGARRMLIAALVTEAPEYVERNRHERDESGRALVVHNGKGQARKLTLGAGTVELKAPRVNDGATPCRWPAPPISWRHRERQHLRHRPRVDPKASRRFPLTDPLYINCSSYLCVQFHPLHPSAHLCRLRQMGYCCRIFTPVQPVYPAASVRDFVSGALTENPKLAKNTALWRPSGWVVDKRY